MIAEKDKYLDIITNKEFRFKTYFCDSAKRIIIKSKDNYTKKTHENFIYNTIRFETQDDSLKFLLCQIGCITTAPYTKIAIITVSSDWSINDYVPFKDEINNGYIPRKSERFAYSIERDEESINNVKKFIQTFDADNLSYIDAFSDTIFKDIIAPQIRYLNNLIKNIKYKDKHFDKDTGKIKKELVIDCISSSNYKIEEEKPASKLKEKNNFIFVSKYLTFENEDRKHNLCLKVGRSKSNPNEKYAVLELGDSSKDSLFFYVKLNTRNTDLNYINECVEFDYSLLNDQLTKEIKALSRLVSYKSAKIKTVYALSITTDLGHYEEESTSHSRIMAMSDDKDELVKRYNKSVKEKKDRRLLIKKGEYNVSYSGNTGGGCRSVKHCVSIGEFRDFDMPEIER